MKSQFRHTYLELPIQHMIQGVGVLLENNGDKFISKNLKILTEKELMHPDQKDTLERLRSALVQSKSNNEFIKLLQLSLSQSEAIYDQFELFGGVIQDYVTDFIGQLKKETQQQKMQYYSQLLSIYERYICQTQFVIMLELYNIHETKIYTLKNEKQLILNHPFIYYGCALLLNEILLMPNEISLQLRAFSLIKKLYEYFPQLKDVLKGPILLVLKNISLFAQTSVELKEPTIFLYQLCHSSPYDEEYKKTLVECQELKYLRENKYYSVKALSFTEDNGQIYNLRSISIQVMFPNYTILNAASIFVYSICIEKPNSIVYWNFKTLDYDVGFGLFKLSQGSSGGDYLSS